MPFAKLLPLLPVMLIITMIVVDFAAVSLRVIKIFFRKINCFVNRINLFCCTFGWKTKKIAFAVSMRVQLVTRRVNFFVVLNWVGELKDSELNGKNYCKLVVIFQHVSVNWAGWDWNCCCLLMNLVKNYIFESFWLKFLLIY